MFLLQFLSRSCQLFRNVFKTYDEPDKKKICQQFRSASPCFPINTIYILAILKHSTQIHISIPHALHLIPMKSGLHSRIWTSSIGISHQSILREIDGYLLAIGFPCLVIKRFSECTQTSFYSSRECIANMEFLEYLFARVWKIQCTLQTLFYRIY